MSARDAAPPSTPSRRAHSLCRSRRGAATGFPILLGDLHRLVFKLLIAFLIERFGIKKNIDLEQAHQFRELDRIWRLAHRVGCAFTLFIRRVPLTLRRCLRREPSDDVDAGS